ncbi:hypothetical protein AVEN_155643-1 [Araneus ventricosus]|uniref:Uncharacterized protein n=1 Tax=Araneus ventricosus TaxID=182803 RepID=A0A4Y2KK20_ARAVE|nr:hypothetical protein AVEN_155643-1 [Araneus ventricosus]
MLHKFIWDERGVRRAVSLYGGAPYSVVSMGRVNIKDPYALGGQTFATNLVTYDFGCGSAHIPAESLDLHVKMLLNCR